MTAANQKTADKSASVSSATPPCYLEKCGGTASVTFGILWTELFYFYRLNASIYAIMFQPTGFGRESMGVRLSIGALACTTDSNWQFFRCCPVIKACLDSYKRNHNRRSSALKRALVANDFAMVTFFNT
jgi:hypothetical protein